MGGGPWLYAGFFVSRIVRKWSILILGAPGLYAVNRLNRIPKGIDFFAGPGFLRYMFLIFLILLFIIMRDFYLGPLEFFMTNWLTRIVYSNITF